jgi:protein phosphatase
MSGLRFHSSGRTSAGNVRPRNEDAILVRDDLGLWVVADGLGGHSAGDVASRAVVEALAALQRGPDLASFVDAIDDALGTVNDQLCEMARARGADAIGSTVVVLVHDQDMLMCGWVGDSRAYAFEHGSLTRLTQDHVVDEPTGDLTELRGRAAPRPGALTRAVGASAQLHVDWTVIGCRRGQRFVLCSDGVNKEMDDVELEAHLRHCPDPESLVDRLIETSLSRVGRDNVSAIALYLSA